MFLSYVLFLKMFFQKPAIENEENLRHCKYLVESPAHSKDILENNCVGN